MIPLCQYRLFPNWVAMDQGGPHGYQHLGARVYGSHQWGVGGPQQCPLLRVHRVNRGDLNQRPADPMTPLTWLYWLSLRAFLGLCL